MREEPRGPCGPDRVASAVGVPPADLNDGHQNGDQQGDGRDCRPAPGGRRRPDVPHHPGPVLAQGVARQQGHHHGDREHVPPLSTETRTGLEDHLEPEGDRNATDEGDDEHDPFAAGAEDESDARKQDDEREPDADERRRHRGLGPAEVPDLLVEQRFHQRAGRPSERPHLGEGEPQVGSVEALPDPVQHDPQSEDEHRDHGGLRLRPEAAPGLVPRQQKDQHEEIDDHPDGAGAPAQGQGEAGDRDCCPHPRGRPLVLPEPQDGRSKGEAGRDLETTWVDDRRGEQHHGGHRQGSTAE